MMLLVEMLVELGMMHETVATVVNHLQWWRERERDMDRFLSIVIMMMMARSSIQSV